MSIDAKRAYAAVNPAEKAEKIARSAIYLIHVAATILEDVAIKVAGLEDCVVIYDYNNLEGTPAFTFKAPLTPRFERFLETLGRAPTIDGMHYGITMEKDDQQDVYVGKITLNSLKFLPAFVQGYVSTYHGPADGHVKFIDAPRAFDNPQPEDWNMLDISVIPTNLKWNFLQAREEACANPLKRFDFSIQDLFDAYRAFHTVTSSDQILDYHDVLNDINRNRLTEQAKIEETKIEEAAQAKAKTDSLSQEFGYNDDLMSAVPWAEQWQIREIANVIGLILQAGYGAKADVPVGYTLSSRDQMVITFAVPEENKKEKEIVDNSRAIMAFAQDVIASKSEDDHIFVGNPFDITDLPDISLNIDDSFTVLSVLAEKVDPETRKVIDGNIEYIQAFREKTHHRTGYQLKMV